MVAARAVVEAHLEAGTPVYGMTTGVAARKRHTIPLDQQEEHNRRLIEDLLVGQGPEASEEVVRATILWLVNGFARGTSGMRPLIADRLVEALNDGAHPSVSMLGSVGMADIAQMAELAHGVFGDLTLAPKDAISLVDNDAFSTALAAFAIHDYQTAARRLRRRRRARSRGVRREPDHPPLRPVVMQYTSWLISTLASERAASSRPTRRRAARRHDRRSTESTSPVSSAPTSSSGPGSKATTTRSRRPTASRGLGSWRGWARQPSAPATEA